MAFSFTISREPDLSGCMNCLYLQQSGFDISNILIFNTIWPVPLSANCDNMLSGAYS